MPTICVVDPRSDDYRTLLETAEVRGVNLNTVATAEEALRVACAAAVDLWVINTDLPGLSGFELCGMLRDRQSKPVICLVADEYSVETEQAAWASRATTFCCKPAQHDWLRYWLSALPTPTSHAPPIRISIPAANRHNS